MRGQNPFHVGLEQAFGAQSVLQTVDRFLQGAFAEGFTEAEPHGGQRCCLRGWRFQAFDAHHVVIEIASYYELQVQAARRVICVDLNVREIAGTIQDPNGVTFVGIIEGLADRQRHR